MKRNLRQRAQTQDSTLAYYVNQLENLDKRLYEPLVSISWSRDLKLRPGITMTDESTSFILSSFALPGSLQNAEGNFPWISAETTAIPGVSVSGEKLVKPLRPLAREISYTSLEIARSQRTGQPLDVQKIAAMNLGYQMNTDQMVYIGSTDVGATGMINNSGVAVTPVANGIGGSPLWANKTPDEIVQDIDNLLDSTWLTAALAICPRKLLLPPTQFGLLASQKVSSAGNMSVLKYVKENCIANEINGTPLDIQPVKWLTGAGVGGTDRMVAYTNDEERIRFPMVPVMRETAYYQGIRFTAPYLWLFGEVEVVYPETLGYGDGI